MNSTLVPSLAFPSIWIQNCIVGIYPPFSRFTTTDTGIEAVCSPDVPIELLGISHGEGGAS